ncbi:MAG: STAS domain-containing protein [Prevotellaceae bacterium]|jgi:anti-anti-sigma factor|nr:STAS domain-containing protein [Prevotellaceae bacterium]
MEVKILNGAPTIIKVSGRLDTVNAEQFGKEIAPVMENMKNVVLDCYGLDYIASSGLRQLLNLQKAANAQKGKLVFRGVSEEIKKIFSLTGFLTLFTLED